MKVSISIQTIGSIVQKIYKLLPKINNLLLRPQLDISIRQQTIIFTSQDGSENHFRYPCLLITNKSKTRYQINPAHIKVNNELYKVILQQDMNFLLLNKKNNNHWIDCKNDIYNIYSNKWFEISQNTVFLHIEPFETKIFPLKLIKSSSHILTRPSNNTFLFCEKSKLNFSIEINRKNYEYGIKRLSCYKTYINYLAFYMETDHETLIKKVSLNKPMEEINK